MYALRKTIASWRQEISGLRTVLAEEKREGNDSDGDEFVEGYARGKEVCANHLEDILGYIAEQQTRSVAAECSGQTVHGRLYLFRQLFAAALAALVFGRVRMQFSSRKDRDEKIS